MDLSFAFEPNASVRPLSADLAMMLVAIVARQAASPTARVQGRLSRHRGARALLAPIHGAFNLAASARPATQGQYA